MMNFVRGAVLFLVGIVCLVHADDTSPLPTQITIDGVLYKNVTWGTPTLTTVTIRHDTGIERVPLAKLPLDLQYRFGYAQRIIAEKQAAAVRRAQEEARVIEKFKGTPAYLDAQNGFRELKFGQSLGETPTMRRVNNDEAGVQDAAVVTYVRDTDDLHFGTIPLSHIQYVYDHDKLASVTLQLKNHEDREAVAAVFTQLYGPPAAQDVWEGAKVKVRLLSVLAIISSKEIEAQQR